MSSLPTRYWERFRAISPLRQFYIFCIVFGFLLRLILSLHSFGSKHPDEIFQSLEIAHSIVYGSGYIPPEFRSSYVIESYAASRSWLFPLIFASIMQFGEFIQLDYHSGTLGLIKIFLAINATLLIPVTKKLTFQITKNERSSVLAAFFVAFWFRLVEYSVRSFTNTFFLPYLFFGIYLILNSFEDQRPKLSKVISVGFLIGLSTYIRLDLGIIVFAFFIMTFSRKRWKWYLLYALSGFLFWLWGAWIDYQYYETAELFSVPVNWFTFNIIENNSAIFGVNGPFFYVEWVLLFDTLILWVFIPLAWILFRRRLFSKIEVNEHLRQGFFKLTWITLISWLIYSYPNPFEFGANPFSIALVYPQSHKEHRFIMSGLVLMLMLIGVGLDLTVTYLTQNKELSDKLVKGHSFKWKKLPILSRLSLSSLFIILLLLFTGLGLTFLQHEDTGRDVNMALAYLYDNQDTYEVRHVMIVERWYFNGQYTYSHFNDSVDFSFRPFDDEFNITNRVLLFNFILTYDPGDIIIIPHYQYQFEDTLVDRLERENWTIIYQEYNVDIWVVTQASTLSR